LEKLAELLCFERRFTPCLWWFFKTEEIKKEIGVDLRKPQRPGLVLDFAGEEDIATVLFLSSKKEYPGHPQVEIGRECVRGSCHWLREGKSYIFIDRETKRCLFKISLKYLSDRRLSEPCGKCREEIKKRVLDECRGG